jgi:hypothetical protein
MNVDALPLPGATGGDGGKGGKGGKAGPGSGGPSFTIVKVGGAKVLPTMTILVHGAEGASAGSAPTPPPGADVATF